jgi:cystathionine beta-lyase
MLPVLNEKQKMIWVETPTNPLMKLADIAIAKITTANDIILAVDNTLLPLFAKATRFR